MKEPFELESFTAIRDQMKRFAEELNSVFLSAQQWVDTLNCLNQIINSANQISRQALNNVELNGKRKDSP